MSHILICLCLGVALLVGSCALVPNPIDRSRKKRALEIAADLKVILPGKRGREMNQLNLEIG